MVLIYTISTPSQTRIGTAPHNIIVDIRENSTVTWANESQFTAKVYGREGNTWSTEEFRPSTEKSIRFNSTGFYEYLVDAGDRHHHGEVVALSEDTNTLPIF